MKIVCKAHREGGTHVTFPGGFSYHFKPDADGDHVCVVNEKAHIDRFLSLSMYKRKGEPEPIPVDTTEQDDLAAAYPLADAPLDTMTNKELATIAREQLGIRGTNKADVSAYARQFLGILDIAKSMPKATYIELLREVLGKVAAAQRNERAEEMSSKVREGVADEVPAAD